MQHKKIPPLPADSELYSALMSHYLHYDQQMWSRTQILLAVEGAALATGYNFRSDWLGPVIMFSAIILVLVIWGLIERDRDNRDVNVAVMDVLVERIVNIHGNHRLISLRSEPLHWYPRGRYLINVVIILLLIIDLVLALIYMCKPDLFPK